MIRFAATVVSILALIAAMCVYTVGLFPALDAVSGVDVVPAVAGKADAAEPAPVHWTKRPAPCFFVGRPGWDRRACGSVRMVKWETYCEPDPKCMELPDGTRFDQP